MAKSKRKVKQNPTEDQDAAASLPTPVILTGTVNQLEQRQMGAQAVFDRLRQRHAPADALNTAQQVIDELAEQRQRQTKPVSSDTSPAEAE